MQEELNKTWEPCQKVLKLEKNKQRKKIIIIVIE